MLNLSNGYNMKAIKINKNDSFNPFKTIWFSIYFRFTIWLLYLAIKHQKKYRFQINSNLYHQNTSRKQKFGQVCLILFFPVEQSYFSHMCQTDWKMGKNVGCEIGCKAI